MEPGHEDREYIHAVPSSRAIQRPQWSPVMKTGNTRMRAGEGIAAVGPQWSPVMKTGNTSD